MMKKNDLEYNLGEEFAALPDEYLQGAGNQPVSVKKRKASWKRMLYMAAAFTVITYEAIAPYAFAEPELKQTFPATVLEQTEYPEKETNVPIQTDSPDSPEVMENVSEPVTPKEEEIREQIPQEPIEEAPEQQAEEQFRLPVKAVTEAETARYVEAVVPFDK